MRIKCLAQGHYCCCQQNRTGDLMIESVVLSTELQQQILSTSINVYMCLFVSESVSYVCVCVGGGGGWLYSFISEEKEHRKFLEMALQYYSPRLHVFER